MEFAEKVALITGASVGIGRAAALLLASDRAAYINGENILIDGCRKKL